MGLTVWHCDIGGGCAGEMPASPTRRARGARFELSGMFLPPDTKRGLTGRYSVNTIWGKCVAIPYIQYYTTMLLSQFQSIGIAMNFIPCGKFLQHMGLIDSRLKYATLVVVA